MEANSKPEAAIEMFRAQAHIYKHAFNYINSMALATATQLNIPDIIYRHGKPITISELVSALKLPPHKSNALYRIMRLLTHNGFFDSTKLNEEEEEEGYVLTAPSKMQTEKEWERMFIQFGFSGYKITPIYGLTSLIEVFP